MLSRFAHLWLLAVALVVVVGSTPAQAQREAADELKALHVPDDLELSLYAAEPLVTNPAAIDIDSHGRVWVAEIAHYRAAAKDPPDDKIKVLEDTDGDGRADKVTVFADNVFCPMSICVAGPRVYVATSPDLWVYEDLDGDLKADGPPKKLLTGFGGYNHDHGAHSVVLGPDHKWWMSHGDLGFKVDGVDGSHIESTWGAVLRGELDGTQLEVVASNFRNPYEVCIDSFGNAYLSDNDNDGNESVRVCWIMQGGDYGWFGRPPGAKGSVPSWVPASEHWHFRGHIPGYVPATRVTGFGAPCGMCFYEGNALGADYKNAAFLADAGPREVRLHRHEAIGAGKRANQRTIIASQGDDYFRPDDVCTAPDGSLFVADWYDGGVGGHAYNNPTQGRIFRLTSPGKKLSEPRPGPYSNVADALEGLKSPNLATQFLARERLITDGAASLAGLRQLLSAEDPNHRARALWVLDRIGTEDARAVVVEQLTHTDDSLRALAVRILRQHGALYAPQLLTLVDDPSPEVRRELLLGMVNFTGPEADKALLQLALGYDGTDRYLLEAINIGARDTARRRAIVDAILAEGSEGAIRRLPLLQALDPSAAVQTLEAAWKSTTPPDPMVLLVAAATNPNPHLAELVLTHLIAPDETRSDVRGRAIELLKDQLVSLDAEFRESPPLLTVVRQLLADPDWRDASLDLIAGAELRGMGPDVLAIVQDNAATPEARRRAVLLVGALHVPGTSAALRSLVDGSDQTLRQAAITGLVDMQDWATVKDVLTSTPAGALRDAVLTETMNSTGGALFLLRALDRKEFSPELTAAVTTLATKHPDANVRTLYAKYIPEDQREQLLGAAIHAADILALDGDAERGEQIFFHSTAARCNSCHIVKGFGKPFGPELTLIGKKYEKATLLETILDPSKAIAPEFVPYVLETEDGLVYAGFLLEQTDKQVVLKDIKGKRIVVPADNVAVLEAQSKSMMPDLVLRDVSAQDAADLLAYLMSLTQPFAALERSIRD